MRLIQENSQFTVRGPLNWYDNTQVCMWIILDINNNVFHHLGRSQMCTGAWYGFRTSKPHSGTLWAAFNQEKALVGAFSVITNLRMELFWGTTFQTPPQLGRAQLAPALGRQQLQLGAGPPSPRWAGHRPRSVWPPPPPRHPLWLRQPRPLQPLPLPDCPEINNVMF